MSEQASKLRGRCQRLYQQLSRDAMLRQNNPVDTLVEFVVAEIGRTGGDYRLDASLPLCLYFATPEDRREFIEMVRAAKPGMVMKEMP